MQAVKPARPYLSADYRNPLLTVTDTKAKPVFGREIFRRYRTQILAAAVAAAAVFYGYTAWHFHNRFYPGTEFFGIKAADMSVYDMKAAVKSKVDSETIMEENLSKLSKIIHFVVKKILMYVQHSGIYIWIIIVLAQDLL